MERSKLYKILGLIMGAILLIVLLIVIFTLIGGRGVSYSYVERTIKEATEKYYSDHPDLLPSSGQTATVGADTLAAEGYMDPMDKLVKKTACTGIGKAYSDGLTYYYSSTLDCGETYISKSGIDYLKSFNTLKVDGSGLYEETVAYPIISEEGKVSEYEYNTTLGSTTRWVYKGASPDNNLILNGENYFIVSFSEQDIRVLRLDSGYTGFDYSYNEATDGYDGKNIYQTSSLLSTIQDAYNDMTKMDKSIIIPHNVCVGNRLEFELSQDGSSECKKVLIRQDASALAAYETILASSDANCKVNLKSCTNNNYLADRIGTWTVTPEANTYTYVFVFSGGELYTQNAKESSNYHLVMTLSPNVKLGGSGTAKDPFYVEE